MMFRDGPLASDRASDAPRRPERGRCAYVTLVTNGDYANGAIALVRSLKLSRTEADIVVMHTDGVARHHLEPLAALGARLLRSELLPTSADFNERHQRGRLHANAPFTKGRKPSFHTPLDNFVKLRLWQLVEYDTCVFIDADTVVVRNIDTLFDRTEFSAAPNVYESMEDFSRMNSGLFVARPSHETFDAMLCALDRPGVFWRRTDQTFLETFFERWRRLPISFNTLQYVWLNLPDLWDWDEISVIHFQYEKPWEADHPKAEMLRPLIDIWHAYRHGHAVPDLARMPRPLVEA